jgi:KUP system potassium uptake protein
MFVTFFDTCMVTLVSLIVWKFSGYAVFLPWLFFATIDGLYLSSALTKVPDGAWFTLTIAGILACLFLLWRFGKENQWKAEAEDRFKLSQLVKKSPDGQLSLTERWGGDQLSSIRGLGIYFDKTGVQTPMVFTQFVSKFGAIPEAMVFFHLHPVEAPTVPDAERYVVSRLGSIPRCYRLVVQHGFMDEVISPDLALLVYEQVRKFVVLQAGDESPLERKSSQQGCKVPLDETVLESAPSNKAVPESAASEKATTGADRSSEEIAPDEKDSRIHSIDDAKDKETVPAELRDEEVRSELAHLDRAFASKIMYVIGKEQMRIKPSTPIFRRVVLETFLWVRENTRAKIANLRLSMDRVVEVGFVKEI